MLNESSFKELLDRQLASGLSVKDFCFNEGMSKSSFYYWRRKLQQPRGPKSFIPLVIKSSTTNLGRQSLKAPQPPSTSVQHPQNDLSMEIVFPNGTKLRVKNNPDLSFLKSLICLYP